MSNTNRPVRRPSTALVILLILAILLTWLAAAYFILRPDCPPDRALKTSLDAVLNGRRGELSGSLSGDAEAAALSCVPSGEARIRFRDARQDVVFSYLDTAALTQGLETEMQAALEQQVAQARLPSEIYDETKAFLPAVLEQAYNTALQQRLSHSEDYMRSETLSVGLHYSRGSWAVTDMAALDAFLTAPRDERPGYDAAAGRLSYIKFHYRLADLTSPGPVPDPGGFGSTTDPALVQSFLETEKARELINGQTMDWSPDKDFLPGSVIYFYLDDTILTIVWQEDEHGAVGTFAETFIADASQLRRKLADDSFGCMSYYYPTELSVQCNAVLALSGDFYDHPDRTYGVYAYNGQVMRSCLYEGETCYFNNKGDMLFSRAGDFASDADAQSFLDENGVMFSLSFGPILVDNGVDVTPGFYPLGEILDTYARCAVGQLGERHYLSMTINCQRPNNNVLVTLRQAADSMIAHGCYNAYTLDGGQTGSIIIGNQLINPVQFGVERRMSDIFYFATAIPEAQGS